MAMGTRTIGVRDEVYDRLRARKRDDESFTDLLDRLLDESTPEWRDGFGTLPADEADELLAFAAESRAATGGGLAERQRSADGELDDETA